MRAETLNWQHVYQEDNSVAPGTRAAVEKASSEGSVDVVVGSDVIYYFPDVRPLSHTVAKLLRPGEPSSGRWGNSPGCIAADLP